MTKKSSHTALGLAILFFLLTAIFTLFIILNKQKTTIWGLNQALIASGIGFTLVAILVNRWSIVEIKRYLKKAEPASSHCDYCHNSPAGPLLCSHCNSIMWNRIQSKYTQVAVFIAHHRWPVLSGFLALLVIAPMSIIYSLKVEKEAEIDRIIERTEAYIERSNELRAKIMNYENSFEHFVIKEDAFNEIINRYTDLSWEYPMLLQEVESLAGGHLTSEDIHFTDTSGIKLAKSVKSIVVDGNNIIDGNTCFYPVQMNDRWIQFLKETYKADQASFTNDQDLICHRKQAAFNLYSELKVQNLILREFALYLRNFNIKNDENIKQLSHIFSASEGVFDMKTLVAINTSEYRMSELDNLNFRMP
ncbi:hypothetical protein [Phaeodactylibacter xiamenensis]|uniref:hypothetical protein n=1 Tax=Phaeodactylibacter xiamenensis TaxID=1524460 RepID=UPI003BA9EB7C